METLEELVYRKPVKKISIHYWPGRELAVHLDGKKLNSHNYSREMFEKLREARETGDVGEIYSLIYGQEKAERPDALKKVQALSFLTGTGDFEVRINSVYLKQITHALPQPLVEEFITLVNKYKWNKGKLISSDEYLTLLGFWIWVKNTYEITNNDELFEDSFIKGLLEGYHKDHKFFKECLENKEIVFNPEKKEEVSPFEGLTVEQIEKAIWDLLSKRRSVV